MNNLKGKMVTVVIQGEHHYAKVLESSICKKNNITTHVVQTCLQHQLQTPHHISYTVSDGDVIQVHDDAPCDWDFTGKNVLVEYNNELVLGVITLSRTSLGGKVKHYVTIANNGQQLVATADTMCRVF